MANLVLDEIKKGLTQLGFNIGEHKTDEFVKQVNDNINHNIGFTLFTKNTVYRNASLEKNPFEYRYVKSGFNFNNGGNQYVGESIILGTVPDVKSTYLDEVGGLLGYTMDNSYLFKNTILNGIIPGGVATNDYETYRSDGNGSVNLTYWQTMAKYVRSSSDDAAILPTEMYLLTESNLGTKTFNVINGGLKSGNFIKQYDFEGYYLYNEYGRTKKFYDSNRNWLSKNVPVLIDESNQDYDFTLEGKSLLHTTNLLFANGKINSLVNRFCTGNKGDASNNDLLHTAKTDKYGYSRGRNLLKEKSDNIHGYENPYCRVWTSHHHYAMIKNLIRPFSDVEYTKDGSSETVKLLTIDKLQENIPFYRPNKGNVRLSENTVLQDNGKIKFSPDISDEIDITSGLKRCMLSIENLAWKDSGLNNYAKLSAEQQGPNGGRIMWFPPYGLSFSETASATWNPNQFIGRGEPIYTYSQSERTGNLSFTILVDHPSVVDAYCASYKEDDTNKSLSEQEQELLRFFAGCSTLPIESSIISAKTQNSTTVVERREDVKPNENPEKESYEVFVPLYYPNNYSGLDTWSGKTENDLSSIKSDLISAVTCIFDEKHAYECSTYGKRYTKRKDIAETSKNIYDLCDKKNKESRDYMKNNYDSYLYSYDTYSFGLNDRINEILSGSVDTSIWESSDNPGGGDFTSCKEKLSSSVYSEDFRLLSQKCIIPIKEFNTFDGKKSLIEYIRKKNGETSDFNVSDFKVTALVTGFASREHGYHSSNIELFESRAKTLKYYLFAKDFCELSDIEIKSQSGLTNETRTTEFGGEKGEGRKNEPVSYGEIEIFEKNNPDKNSGKTKSRSSFSSKYGRCAFAKITITKDRIRIDEDVSTYERTVTTSTTTITRERRLKTSDGSITIRPDAEYQYFKHLSIEDNITYDNIRKKFSYFDPAFHSITPEGFNARLTFLQQCTRQGPTTSASNVRFSDDIGNERTMGAGNLSFGRPPFCILKIGDFLNCKIIIDNVQIEYDNDGIAWDLNPEGIGVQPMFAKVTLGIKILGGCDITGPIDRLQNAVSSNYYANTSIYDKRSITRNSNGEEFTEEDDDFKPIETTVSSTSITDWRLVDKKTIKGK